MNVTIRWSPRSVYDIENHLDYLEKRWDEEVVAKVLDRIEYVLDSISNNPKLYPLLDTKRKIHRCVVSSQIVLYYRINETNIELITFWDTRQNPENLHI